LAGSFPIQNGLNKGEDLSSFLFKVSSEDIITKAEENERGIQTAEILE
jgi:hypothetical protein